MSIFVNVLCARREAPPRTRGIPGGVRRFFPEFFVAALAFRAGIRYNMFAVKIKRLAKARGA